MESQLTLIDLDEDLWTLDQHTRQTGRRGIANAREALRLAAGASARHEHGHEHEHDVRTRSAA